MQVVYRFVFLLLLVPTASHADVRELSQNELRKIVSASKAIDTRHLIADVESVMQGHVVNVRAFLVENMVTYRVMVRQAGGHLNSVMVDGKTGFAVDENSAVGRRVKAVVDANASATGL
jgi:hypothetical protein